MAGSIFLAMTAAELRQATAPAEAAYMACHFSPYGKGLSNIPDSLPPGAMLILNDRIPIGGHDPALVAEQLTQAAEALGCSCVLLDLQRPDCEETKAVCREVAKRAACPVGISEHYCAELPGAVFLPPLPPCMALSEHLAPWQGREIWLEVAPEHWQLILTEAGCHTLPLPYCPPPEEAFAEKALHCRYRQRVYADRAEFFLYRTLEDVDALLQEAQTLGVTKAVGLWQQFCQ